MTIDQKLEILDKKINILTIKIDGMFSCLSIMPNFIMAPHRKDSNSYIRDAGKKYNEICQLCDEKLTEEIKKYEDYSDIAGFKDTIS